MQFISRSTSLDSADYLCRDMTAEDSPPGDRDRVCLILQAAQDLEIPNPNPASNNVIAGTSGAVSPVKRKRGCSSQGGGADKDGTSMLANFLHEEISGIIMLIITS